MNEGGRPGTPEYDKVFAMHISDEELQGGQDGEFGEMNHSDLRWIERTQKSLERSFEAADNFRKLESVMKRRGCAEKIESQVARLAIYLSENGRDDLAGLVLLTNAIEPLLRSNWLTREIKVGAGIGSHAKYWKNRAMP